jgi:hypothetical protein
LGVFESEAQEQELSQVELPRELLREAQKGGCRGLVRLLTSCQTRRERRAQTPTTVDNACTRTGRVFPPISTRLARSSQGLSHFCTAIAKRSATRNTGAGGKGGASGTEASKVQTETPRPECTLTGRGDWASATGPATACIVAGGSSQVPHAQVVLDSRRKSRKNGNAHRVHLPDHQNSAAPDKGVAASHLRKGSKPPVSARFAGWPLRKETSERELARTYEHLWQAYTGKIHERLDSGAGVDLPGFGLFSSYMSDCEEGSPASHGALGGRARSTADCHDEDHHCHWHKSDFPSDNAAFERCSVK